MHAEFRATTTAHPFIPGMSCRTLSHLPSALHRPTSWWSPPTPMGSLSLCPRCGSFDATSRSTGLS